MNRYKTLFSNTLIFVASDFASKLLVFFMLPLYTRVMTTGEFGASDLVNSSVGLLLPIFTLRIADGAMRFAMSRDADDRQVFSFGLKVILYGFGILLLLFPVFMQINVIRDYLPLFYLLFISSALYNYLNQFARGINKIKLVGIAGVSGTVITVFSNIILLVIFRLGVTGYLSSFIISHLICSALLFFGAKMHRYIILKPIEKQLKKEMMGYSIPLAPNSLSWWLNNTANRYIISAFCGVSQVGLFAAATRIPTILTTMQGIFYQAWQLSAITEYEKEDKQEFFSKVYRFYNLFMLLGCSFLIMAAQPIAQLLFSGPFLDAWIYIPLLLVSVVFGAMSGFLGSFYSASKKTNMLFITTLAGGIIAVSFNFILVPFWGPMGASASSVVSYGVVWLMRLIDSRKYVRLSLNLFRDIQCYVLVILQAIAVVNLRGSAGYTISFVIFISIVVLNKEDLRKLWLFMWNIVKSRLKRGL